MALSSGHTWLCCEGGPATHSSPLCSYQYHMCFRYHIGWCSNSLGGHYHKISSVICALVERAHQSNQAHQRQTKSGSLKGLFYSNEKPLHKPQCSQHMARPQLATPGCIQHFKDSLIMQWCSGKTQEVIHDKS